MHQTSALPPAAPGPIYVFLDFDGVTHPWGEAEDFRCLPEFEKVLRDYPEVLVVIASDWRTLFSLPKLAARFATDIQPRVVDVTPAIFPKTPQEFYGLREKEARQWLDKHPDAAGWLAVDDAPGNWPTKSRLVLTDFKRGFTDEDALRLRRMLDAFRADNAATRVG
jgi:hypothetical protein